MADAEIRLDLYAETGEAMMRLRYAQSDLTGGGGVDVDGGRGQRWRFYRRLILLDQAAAQA